MKLDERRRLHGLPKETLKTELQDAEQSLLEFRFAAGMNRLANPAGMHNARKRIAVLKTLIREIELLDESGFASMDEYKAYRNAERRMFRESRKAR